jgi:hypothetical protein
VLTVLLVGFVTLSLLRVDISFRTRPGPPKFIRIVHGEPSVELFETEKRDEVIFGGCSVYGYVPRWLLVW